MAYFLGLDLGTSALKGLVFDQTRGTPINTLVLTIHCHPQDLGSVSKSRCIGMRRLIRLSKP